MRIEADPPPPFTYWAPAGSVIRNRAPGIWFAEVAGEAKATYVGDACRASEYQRYVGGPVSALPAKPTGANWVVACLTCPRTADLRLDRMDVAFDPMTNRVREIRCG